MHGKIIEVERLVKRYDRSTTVLDDISFSVEERDFVVINGKSGCGKTTLLNMLGGLDRPDSGQVVIDGQNIVGLTEDELAKLRREKIGFVFQDYNLLMDLTVRENVRLPLRFSKRENGGRVDELLEKFEIKNTADKTASRISGGEAQRVAIARAMMSGPKIILADEPTGNLDLENTLNVMESFQLARRDFGTTIVLATHDRDLARSATLRIQLDGGKALLQPPS
jgi:putative ABC transport system ATP-binding protein